MTSRRLPPRPSLEHARKSAKDLLEAYRARDPEAAARLRHAHPRLTDRDDEAILDAGLRLADAQLVIARELGFDSWPKLKERIVQAGLDFEARVRRAIEAALEGGLDRVRIMLDDRPEIATADVFAAATFGESEAMQSLLQRDPSLARARGGPRDWEPLLYLGLSRLLGRDEARSAGLRATARLLLASGADPNVHAVMGSPEFKQTPLYGAAGLASDPELTQMLLEAGADPNDQTEFLGPESLYHASEHRDNRCLALLLAAGPDPDKVSYCLGRKLDFEDPAGVALYLRHGADPNFRNPFGDEQTRLHKAVLAGRSIEIVEMLLEAGADPDLRTKNGHSALALAVRLGRVEAAERMRAAGADMSLVSDVDRFLGACARGDEEAISASLDADPEILARLEPGDQAVLAAVAFEGRVEALRAMLRAGFDPNARGDFGPAVNLAAWRGQALAVQALLEAGADPALRNDYGGTALGSALHGLEHCHSPEGGTTAAGSVSEARQADYARILDLLLGAGADPAELPEPPTGRPEIDWVLAHYSG